jgi:hypothetical protein
MPPDIRRQYETAMKLLSENTHMLAHASPGDINISTSGSDPTHRVFKTVTTMTGTHRIVVNGKEYARLEDVPLSARAALKLAGVGSQIPHAPVVNQIPDGYQLNNSSTVSFSRATLTFLLLFAMLVGVCVGIFIGYKVLH